MTPLTPADLDTMYSVMNADQWRWFFARLLQLARANAGRADHPAQRRWGLQIIGEGDHVRFLQATPPAEEFPHAGKMRDEG